MKVEPDFPRNMDRRRQIRSFVIRGGRMSPGQERAFGRLYDEYTVSGPIRPSDLFPLAAKLVVEIGFGMGEAIASMASSHPEWGFVGIEVHKPGIGKLLSQIEEQSLENVRIVHGDAAEVLEHRFEPGSVHGVHIFFPDPWPKKRHHKRRLIQPHFVSLMSRILVPSGYVYVVTDWEGYADQILEVLTSHPFFDNPFDGFADPVALPVRRQETKFERKGQAKGHRIREIYVKRIA